MNSRLELKETQIGRIPEDWEILSIGSVSEVIGGTTPSTREAGNFGGEIAWITPKDLSNYRFRYITRGERNITKRGMESCSLRMLPKGAVLLTTRAPIGYVAIAENEVTTNQGFRSLIPNKKTTSEFLYYLLKLNTDKLKAHASGTTFGELAGGTLKSLEFGFPPITEQFSIAKILSVLDSKIELNLRMNATLEAFGQALFKRWFVDFEYPNEEGKPYKSSGGEMVDSNLGKIPLGWRVGHLGEIIENLDAKRIPLSSRERVSRRGPYPYYGAASVLDYVDDFIFDGVYVLMAEDGTVIDEKDHPIVQYVWDKFWVNNHAHVIEGKQGVPTEFVLLLLKQSNVKHLVTGAVQPKINQQNMNSLAVVVPPREVLDSFGKLASPIFAKYRLNSEEVKCLSEIRDSLLPKLMSGEISVVRDDKKIGVTS